MLLTVTALRD
uniref:Uncharacterized protein n=1 Tax=Arundo donax TaxID=35708 RepID=A0A0A9DW42_ARUDO